MKILIMACILFLLPLSSSAADRVVVIPLFDDQRECPDGLIECGGKCVDNLHNPQFCGGCDTACNSDEYCDDGYCAKKCDDGNVCTDDIYDSESGRCKFEPNNESCDDGEFCNGTESCIAGVCGNHTGNPCSGPDGDSDCSESCNEDKDVCNANDPDESECNDGYYCNGSDSCIAGVCGSHTGNPCSGPDGDSDCSESCDENDDTCSADDPFYSLCDDGNPNTKTDTCQNGICIGG